MTNVSDLCRRQHLTQISYHSVDGPGEVGAGDLTKPPFRFSACLAHGQFTEEKR
jgi:hypothetical protein